MKKTALVILLALIVVPVTTSAFSLDGAIKQWMTYMRAKVQTLEKENAALKAQLAAQSDSPCAVTALTTQTSEEREWKKKIEELSIQNLKLSNAINAFNATTAMNPDELRTSRMEWKKSWASVFPSVAWNTQDLSTIADTFKRKMEANTEDIAFIEIKLASKGYPFIHYTGTPSPKVIPKVIVTAHPEIVEYDGTSTISWKAQWAASCTLNSSPALLASTGSKPTGSLTTSTTYTFTCTDKNTAVTGSTTVNVKPWAPKPGVKLLPAGQCTRATAPCITSEECWGCNEEGRCGREFGQGPSC